MAAPKYIPYDTLVEHVTFDVSQHPRDLSRHYMERFGVSRVTASKYIQRLERDGWIARSGTSTHPVYAPGYKRRRSIRLPLSKGLDEDAIWEGLFSAYFSFSPNIRNIAHHGFTEMLNNAIDHSQGKHVYLFARQSEEFFSMLVSDDGVGIFKKISDALQLADPRLAIFELAKGKLTTDPTKHSGEGIFFTSRMFDSFVIDANDLSFNHFDQRAHDHFEDFKTPGTGTAVYMVIQLASTRTTTQVFDAFTNAPEDYAFNKTVVPMKLARFGTEQLVSRSQAKRLIARFDRFKIVVLDFEGVTEIGQGFADELFRVYANEHKDVQLVPQNMAEQVERMWLRAINNDIAKAQNPS